MNPLRSLGTILDHERDRWMLWAPVGMAFGIAVYFALSFEPPMWVLAATPVAALLTWASRQRLALLVPSIFLLTFALGFNAAQIDTRLSYAPMLDRETGLRHIEGDLMMTEVMPKGVRLTLRNVSISRMDADRTPLMLRVKFNNKALDDLPPPGARIRFWGEVGPFSGPVMPGANDFRRQSYFKQIGGLGWSASRIETIPEPPPKTWRETFTLMFEHARITLAHHVYAVLSGDVAAMTAARMNGEQTAISEPVIEAMRISGLAHLLSTSGFHVTIMGILIYYPMRALLALIPWVALRFPIKKWAAFGAILSTLGYTLLVGAPAATLRSMLMCFIAMLAIIADRRSNALRLVMLSAAFAMLLAPDAMLGPSFQMSFAAVFCLIASHEKTFAWATSPGEKFLLPGWLRNSWGYLRSIIRTSLIATAATTPYCLYHFQTFSFYGFIANAAAIPLTSFWVMPCILMAYFMAPLGLDGWFLKGAGVGIWVTIKIALGVASLPYSIFYLPAMPAWALAVMTLGGLWLCIWREKWRYLGLVAIAVGAIYPLVTPLPDVMIAPDGKQWAARLDDGRLAIANIDRDEFIYTQWQQRLGMPPAVDSTELTADFGQLHCDDAGCVYRHDAQKVAFPFLPAAALEDCARSTIVVAPFHIRDCAAPHILENRDFWQHGAHAIYFRNGGLTIETAREQRALRPWSVGWRPAKVNDAE